MNVKKLLIGALASVPLLSTGQTLLSFQDIKTYTQSAPLDLSFSEGEWRMELSDGSFRLSPCFVFIDTDGVFSSLSPVFIPPVIGCPLGTTALVVGGDVDGDGVRDGRGFLSVAPVPIPFANVAPFRSREIKLAAAPISQLPRPLGNGGWTDDTISLWYDQVNFPVRAFNLTRYVFTREYNPGPTELDRMMAEIVPGQYIFDFPRNPAGLSELQRRVPFPIAVAHRPMLEGFPGRSLIPGQLSFFLQNDADWVNGELLIDPRIGYRFQWAGLQGQHILAGDSTEFSMVDPDTGEIVFPAYPPTVPEGQRVPETIPTPSSDYQLGPGFFIPGQRATARIRYQRDLASSGISSDNSIRIFEWNIRFVESFDGFVSFDPFARNQNEDDIAPDVDFDGDGFTNIAEYALLTDMFNPADSPQILPTVVPGSGKCQFSIPRRQGVTQDIRYEVEVAVLDPVDDRIIGYRTIREGDDQWVILPDVDTTAYTVRSRYVPSDPRNTVEACLLRPKITKIER